MPMRLMGQSFECLKRCRMIREIKPHYNLDTDTKEDKREQLHDEQRLKNIASFNDVGGVSDE